MARDAGDSTLAHNSQPAVIDRTPVATRGDTNRDFMILLYVQRPPPGKHDILRIHPAGPPYKKAAEARFQALRCGLREGPPQAAGTSMPLWPSCFTVRLS